MLVIDSRERALQDHLTLLGTAFKTANLAVGDILIQKEDGEPLLVAERKSHSDFAASLKDGRYKEQRARLMATRGQGVAVLYILEGTWSPTLNHDYSGVSEIQLQRLTSRLILRYGLPVLHTGSIRETAQWCGRLLGQIQDDPEVFHPQKGLAAETVGAMAAYTATFSTVKKGNKDAGGTAISMLSAVPGLGAKKVTVLLASTSIADLCAMNQESLAALDIGGKKLGIVSKALHEALHAKT